MTIGQAMFLAVLQGATEFLPVSSTGHMSIAQRLMGLHDADFAGFAIFLHFGTLLSVLAYYRRDFWAMMRSLWTWSGPAGVDAAPERRLLGLLVLGTIPAAIVGWKFESAAKGNFNNLTIVGMGLLATAAFLAFAQWMNKRINGRRELAQTSWKDALLVGILQSVSAVFRGFSRSGATVSCGLTLGLSREWAPRFAFLLSAPIILGSSLVEGKELLHQHLLAAQAGQYLVGVAIAAIVGFIAIHALVKIVRKGNLLYFSAYCALVGLAVLIAIKGGSL